MASSAVRAPLQIKICGITNVADAQVVAEAGADMMGIVVEVPGRARSRPLEQAQDIAAAARIPLVVLTVNLPLPRLLTVAETLRPFALQLHGQESPEFVCSLRQSVGCQIWKVIPLPLRATALSDEWKDYIAAGADVLLIDAAVKTGAGTISGGLGVTADWTRARELVRVSPVPVFLAGGLTPQNVADAVRAVKPSGVDVSSGVEHSAGVKDAQKVRDFITAARGAVG
ncbi:MAG: phosphoribosylanthranilate isomerase [Abditibacteriales bacterium]|nr:phosphoribosylanthranilate isomerase [Abditibacteriales bacterium]MDW8367380.1 phosphoribosylanthranilate isomerase [Abditibacteriales bacterium]